MIDSNGLPITVIRDPDVSLGLAAGTNTVGGVEIRSAGTDLSFVFGRAAEPRNGNSLVLPVQHVDDEGGVIRQSTLVSIDQTLLNGSVAVHDDTVAGLLEAIRVNSIAGTLHQYTLFNAATGTGASSAVDVSGRKHHTVQHVITGVASVQTRSSMNGVHWHVESVDRASNVVILSGAAKFIDANYVCGTGVVTTYLSSAV